MNATSTSTTSMTGVGGVVSVAELRAAWRAAAHGMFRHPATAECRNGGSCREEVGGHAVRVWSPGALVLPVVGCHGSAGATTVALAVATATGGPVRVVEAAGAGNSGLAGAATVEFGATGTGWVRGHRDQVVLDRLQQGYSTPMRIPVPDLDAYPVRDEAPRAGPVPVVLDAGWDVQVLALADGWLPAAVAAAGGLVLVTTATVPGMRRLDGALHALDVDLDRTNVVVAVRGPVPRRWPRQVTHAPGPLAQALLDRALVPVPHTPGLAVRGLDTNPLPGVVLAAATKIPQLLGMDFAATHHQNGDTSHAC